MKLLLLIIIIAGLFSIPFLNGCTSSQPETDDATELVAIDFQLQNLDGDEVKLSDFAGQPVMLNFWAIRCPPCRDEMPFFQEVYEDEEWIQKGLVILAVNDQENADDVRFFMEENRFSFTVLLDITGEVGYIYNIMGLPTTLVIDKDGIIRGARIGAFWDKAHIEQGLVLITE